MTTAIGERSIDNENLFPVALPRVAAWALLSTGCAVVAGISLTSAPFFSTVVGVVGVVAVYGFFVTTVSALTSKNTEEFYEKLRKTFFLRGDHKEVKAAEKIKYNVDQQQVEKTVIKLIKEYALFGKLAPYIKESSYLQLEETTLSTHPSKEGLEIDVQAKFIKDGESITGVFALEQNKDGLLAGHLEYLISGRDTSIEKTLFDDLINFPGMTFLAKEWIERYDNGEAELHIYKKDQSKETIQIWTFFNAEGESNIEVTLIPSENNSTVFNLKLL